ncbi:conserved Plasmodium protein, unknown function [Plasmodium knowlesi strain H]|uniref:Uncharacterized protein n=3 Tax=Plasmodium knowlesi TaxID=5850 RepID=A0A5K1VJT7_PLAKH|nr:conserved Plasmodium protein, unknown function [Plasmodium knowlesi strain H]OTN65126.1 Uncharacterized protein PKNOH_S120150000 [Plasmodium knowlesi]CAA9988357.1 conserved Plasmodium protein, unknown function [Plasmodium knowlesi strain H]SBO20056.1 conserved Plasmodium protein, unknown function [Plasmodium knowlesi strain H]SBO20315.1 conserved Plasmodium protein, unknown function [Plasmodium knowlesi strain H]VVS77831.1 conserved Plasmodium protein, unknown function [Plasmodium knowlesi |eukprot:XP_002259337.1 hypothetical protein, conserved in Plasmodium species [Plasmodium knowlesi strain H]
MENFFTKKVQNVFAILKRNNQEEGDNSHGETKKIKSDDAGENDKKKNASPKVPTEKDTKRKLNNDATARTDRKENVSTEATDNDHSLIKKRKLIKLHNKENVYLIDNFINIKKSSESNYSNGKDVKKKGTSIPTTGTSPTILNKVTLNTPNICNLFSIKKDEIDKKGKVQETRLINSSAQSEGDLEQTPEKHLKEQAEMDNSLKKGKNTNLITTINTCTKKEEEEEEDEKGTVEKKKNHLKEEQNDQAFLRNITDKKSEMKKQKTNHVIINTNNANQKDNSLSAKDTGGEKKFNRIDEIFKNLIEESKKKEKQLSIPDSSRSTPCHVNHINTPHGDSALNENEKVQNLDDESESTKRVDECNPNGNAVIGNAKGKIMTQETLHEDGEPGEQGQEGQSPTHEMKLQREELPQWNGSHDSLAVAKTDSPIPSPCSSVLSGTGRSLHSLSVSPDKEDIKSMDENQPEEQVPLCGDDKSTPQSEGATVEDPACEPSETDEVDILNIKFPQFAMNQSKKLINETNEFFNMYDLELKVEHLPMVIPSDLKLLMERKKKIVCIISDYKNELRQRSTNSRREEKKKKGKDGHEGQVQTVVEATSLGEVTSEKQENEATPGKCLPHDNNNDNDNNGNNNDNNNNNNNGNDNDNNDNNNNNNNSGIVREELEIAHEPTVSPKTEEVKPELPMMENKTPVKNCETVTDQCDVEFVPESRNRSFAKGTENHVQDGLNQEEVKKGNKHLQGRKKRKGEEKKLETGPTSYDSMNYLSDDDKEMVEREHRNFLNLLEKVNRGNCAGGVVNQPNEEQQGEDTIHMDTAPQVEKTEVSKEEFIKSLMEDLTQNCSEEKNYEEHKEIKDEETKFQKLKESITRIKMIEKKIDVLLSSSENLFKYTNMYRRRQILHEKMLTNWSYVQNSVNKKNDVRNRNLPFQLLELDKDLTENIPKVYHDILLDEFAGIIITLNISSSKTTVDGNSIHVQKIVCGCLIEYLDTSEINIKCIWAHPFLNAKSTYYILSAFLPRVILEAFLNYRTPSQKQVLPKELVDSSALEVEHKEDGSPKQMIQTKKKKSFYDRLHQLKENDTNEGKTMKKKNERKRMDNSNIDEEDAFFSNFAIQQYPAMYFLNFSKDCAELLQKFDMHTVEADRKNEEGSRHYSYPTWEEDPPHEEDLPCEEDRQDSEAEGKNKSGGNKSDKFLHIIFSDIDIFPRQCYLILCSYKYMCLNMHYDTDCYSVHYDLNLKNIQKENIGKNTELSNVCPCTSVKDISSDAEDSYDRIIGCSELYMYYMMPKREEREKLGLLERNGWRDLIPNTFNEDISENISKIVKTRTSVSNLYDHISIQNKQNEKNYTTAYINKYEWCGLKMKDIRNMMNEDFNYESPKKK